MTNGMLNSVDFLYTPYIEDVKKYSKYTSPNTFVISSYYNPGTYVGFDFYKGISYELYYIDNDNNINQLTYNLVPGNGLSIKNNGFEINIDNDTIKKTTENSSYFFIDENTFKEASYLNRGIFGIENDRYFNDKLCDIDNDKGAFTIGSDKKLELSNGLWHDLLLISDYYKKCNNIMPLIEDLFKKCTIDLDVDNQVNVGDILYYNNRNQSYTLKDTNKAGENNTPVMVCVIASNILEDSEPRFLPLKRNMASYEFDNNSKIQVKSAFNKIPIYKNINLDKINVNSDIIDSTYGYIAQKRKDWKQNAKNPLDNTENYYLKGEQTMVESNFQNISLYLNDKKINYNDSYSINTEGLFTSVINDNIQSFVKNKILYVITTIKFSNDITKYYLCNLKYKNGRFVNTNKIYGYYKNNTITENFTEASKNTSEIYSLLSKKENVNNQQIINYTTLKDANIQIEEPKQEELNNQTIKGSIVASTENNEEIIVYRYTPNLNPSAYVRTADDHNPPEIPWVIWKTDAVVWSGYSDGTEWYEDKYGSSGETIYHNHERVRGHIEILTADFQPSPSEEQIALKYAWQMAEQDGWPIDRTTQESDNNQTYTYWSEYERHFTRYDDYTGLDWPGHYAFALAYSIIIKKKLKNDIVVYEEDFDSSKMIWEAFQSKMELKLSEFKSQAKQSNNPLYGLSFTIKYN